MMRYVVLMLVYPVLVGLGFQAWIGDLQLTFGIVGLTLVLSSTIVFFSFLGRR